MVSIIKISLPALRRSLEIPRGEGCLTDNIIIIFKGKCEDEVESPKGWEGLKLKSLSKQGKYGYFLKQQIVTNPTSTELGINLFTIECCNIQFDSRTLIWIIDTVRLTDIIHHSKN